MTIDFSAGRANGSLDVRWMHGSARRQTNADPPIQVHWYDDHSAILRQNKAIHYEAPFLYLLFGNERAFLFDTGATADPARMPTRATIDDLIDEWLASNPRDRYELLIVHSHGHGDHTAGDQQFDGRPLTTLVSKELDDVIGSLGFSSWPDETVRIDLGGRVLEVTGIPGHHKASVAVYDAWTGWLLTGDTVYPGRLYVEDMPAFVDSIERLCEFASNRPVSAVLGCHIEMTTTPRRDYPLGATYQPSEPPLELDRAVLDDVRRSALSIKDRPGAHAFDRFIIFNGPCTLAAIGSMARNLRDRLLYAARLRS